MTDCVTGKVRYRDETAAKLVMATIRTRKNHERRAKGESRAYRCSDCDGWHLTSVAKGKR